MLWRIVSPVISPDMSRSPSLAKVDIFGPSSRQQFFQSLLNHCHLDLAPQKRFKKTSAKTCQCECWRWKSIVRFPIEAPYHLPFLNLWWLNCRLACAPVDDEDHACHGHGWAWLIQSKKKPWKNGNATAYRVWDSLGGVRSINVHCVRCHVQWKNQAISVITI